MVLVAQCAETPVGNPFAPDTASLDIPVAPAVVIVMEGLNAVLIHNVGVEDAALAVFDEITVMVPVA